MNIPFIAANWKMNTTVAEAEKLVGTLLGPLSSIDGIEKVLCPPFVSLSLIKTILQGSNIKLGAQNMYFEAEGAYTGEISPLMLSELCEYVILGHSERRRYFKENDNMINKKIRAALENKLKPILCVGEILEENMSGKTEKVIRRQLTGDLTGVEATHDIVIAYEPVWAIGTGRASSGEQAVTTIKFIRNVITELWNKDIALNLRILYGGSVNSSNVTEFVSHPEIDGALVGGASLKTDEFVDIISQTAFIKKQAFRNN
ncbi:MAG: triose-phosphate isomerase [Chloroflexota bacterium]|nr:triose-phosphate isomerase [Chloroflexota bacterium]